MLSLQRGGSNRFKDLIMLLRVLSPAPGPRTLNVSLQFGVVCLRSRPIRLVVSSICGMYGLIPKHTGLPVVFASEGGWGLTRDKFLGPSVCAARWSGRTDQSECLCSSLFTASDQLSPRKDASRSFMTDHKATLWSLTYEAGAALHHLLRIFFYYYYQLVGCSIFFPFQLM